MVFENQRLVLRANQRLVHAGAWLVHAGAWLVWLVCRELLMGTGVRDVWERS